MSLNSEAAARIVIRRRVEWIDTDAAGIYHWSAVVRFAEAAETALHNALGIADRTFGVTPRVSAGFNFHRPLRFNDEVSVCLAVDAMGRSSVRYRLRLVDAEDRTVADGQVTCCLVDAGLGRSCPWPEDLRAALSAGGPQPEA